MQTHSNKEILPNSKMIVPSNLDILFVFLGGGGGAVIF